MLSIKKELKIYRGTYDEIVALETEDMALYFSWDTQEIFVGNKFGVKTPYIGGNRLSEREIRGLVTGFTDELVETLRSQILATNIKATTNESDIETLTLKVETLEGSNNEDIVNAVVAILVGEEGALSNYYTKAQTDSKITSDITTFTYSKSQIDLKLPIVENFAADYTTLKNRVGSLETADNEFNSVKVLNSEAISESQLIQEINSAEGGLYTFQTSAGYELLIINESDVIRIKPEGRVYKLSDETWSLVDIDPAIIKSINGNTTSNGSVTLDADDIADTATRKWNNLLPQANNVVNPLGRNQSYNLGESSVALGYNSGAEGSSSIAIGNSAIASGNNSIQLGTGSNISANTLNFMGHQLVNSSGKIPTERIIERFFSHTVSILTSDWNESSKEVVVSVTGILSDSLIWVSPLASSDANLTAYTRSNVRAIAQGENVITFKCDFIPTTVTVNLVWRS
jgi:hypothetical protein